MELKQSLRLKGKSIRAQLSPEQRKAQSDSIFETVVRSPLFTQADCLLTYISLPSEPDTTRLIRYAFEVGIPVAAPVILNRRMRFIYFEDFNRLEPGPLGIYQPTGQAQPLLTSQTLCLVPGLLFDRRGYRVGFGGGYYDRFLSDFPGQTVGLCFKESMIEEIPNDPWDQPVGWIALPGELVKTTHDK